VSVIPRVPLGAIAEIERDIVAPEAISAGTTYVGLENIVSGGEFVDVGEVDDGELKSAKFAFSPSHILYGKLRPYLAKIALPGFRGVCSTDILPIKPGPKVCRRYLAYFLRQPEMVDLATTRSTGANLPRLNPHELAKFEVPLPPLDEQRRIAAILDRADALRAKRRAALAQLDDMARALFVEMFGDPTLPKAGIRVERLGALAAKIGSGATPTGGEAAYKTEGVALIRSMNVRDGAFSWRDLARLDANQARKLDSVEVASNDVLLNITGASVARVCRAPADVLPARVNQHVSIIRPKPALRAEYLEHCLLHPSYKAELLKIAEAGATRQAITKAQIEALRVPVPDLALQDRFVEAVLQVAAMREAGAAAARELDSLFTSLQHRAFRGEL
jgi:type I restriction enzyme S subunit